MAFAVFVALGLGGCAHDPAGALIHYDMGLEASKSGNTPQAIEQLQQAIKRDPNLAEAHNALGLLYHISLGRPELAEPEYLMALDLKPEFSEASNNLGALYLSLNRWSEAEQRFRKALSNVLYATPHLARGNLGWALFKQGKTKEAIAEIKSAVLTQPKFCQGYRSLGLIHLEIHDSAAAVEDFSRFATACPEEPEAFWKLGDAKLRAGDVDGAKLAWDRCSALADQKEVGEQCRRARMALDSQAAGSLGGGGGRL